MLTDLGVDISKITKIVKAVLEVRVNASARRDIAVPRGAGIIRHIAAPTMWAHNLTEDGKVKITKAPRISNLADLGTKHLAGETIRRVLERCHCYICEGRAGIALRAEVQEITRSHPEVFTVDNACEVDTQSAKGNTVNRHAPLHKPNLNKRQCHANRTVRRQPDHNNVEDNLGRDCTKLVTEFFEFERNLTAIFRSVQ